MKKIKAKIAGPRLASAALSKYGNADLIQAALEAWMDDIDSGAPTRSRYTRVRDRLVREQRCSHDAAEDAIRGGRRYNADTFASELTVRVAEISDQLQRIADDNQQNEPATAVAALRELGKLNGLYAAKQVRVEHAEAPTVQTQLRAVLDVLSPQARAGLELALGEIEAAKANGRLALAEAVADAEDAN